MRDFALPRKDPLNVFEIGCGAGILRKQIEDLTAWTIDGAELNDIALKMACPSRGRTMLYNIHERLPSLKERYEVVVLFDVLEHIENQSEFLKSALWHLKPRGWVIVNVPALQCLYSHYDKLVGHYRRYEKAPLGDLLAGVGLEVVDLRYWGFSLLPIAALRKLIMKQAKTPQNAIERGFDVSPPINILLKTAMVAETAILDHPPYGISLMALARNLPLPSPRRPPG